LEDRIVRLDRIYILAGFAWLIFGMMFGIYLGITDQLQFANSHAHANLLGFVVSVLFGLLLRNWPPLLNSRLAMPQFVIYQFGVVILVAGKFDIDSGGRGILAPPGAMIVVLGTFIMFWMFASAEYGPNVTAPGLSR